MMNCGTIFLTPFLSQHANDRVGDNRFIRFVYLFKDKMSLVLRKSVFGFPTRSHTNRAVKSQKMARGLKFRMQIEEGLYYLCSENKGADQLRSYREADLCLSFRICKKPVFSRRGSNGVVIYTYTLSWQQVSFYSKASRC